MQRQVKTVQLTRNSHSSLYTCDTTICIYTYMIQLWLWRVGWAVFTCRCILFHNDYSVRYSVKHTFIDEAWISDAESTLPTLFTHLRCATLFATTICIYTYMIQLYVYIHIVYDTTDVDTNHDESVTHLVAMGFPYPSSDVLVDRLRNHNVKSPDALRHRSRRYRYLYIYCEAIYGCIRFTPAVKQTVTWATPPARHMPLCDYASPTHL